jgi:hypothetical protein
MKSIERGLAFAGCIAVALGLAGSVLGQGTATAPPPGAGAPGIINPKAAERSRQLAEGRLRSAEMDAGLESEKQKHIQEALVHIKEDFTRIQVLRNDIARDLVARKPLNYKLVYDQTSEINKRASRLNIYMMAHPSENAEGKEPSELKDEEMIGALVRLCKLVDSFTENPALSHALTVNVKEINKAKEDKAKADRDLLAIIKLSELIKKKSDYLRTP